MLRWLEFALALGLVGAVVELRVPPWVCCVAGYLAGCLLGGLISGK